MSKLIELKEFLGKLFALKTVAGSLKIQILNDSFYPPKSEQVHLSKKNAEKLRDYLNEQYPSDGWISVDERLPEYRVECLITYNGNFVSIGKLDDGDWCNSHGCPYDVSVTVTHWQPLPELPRGGIE